MRMTIFGEHILTLLQIAVVADVTVNGTQLTLVIVAHIMEVLAQEVMLSTLQLCAVHVMMVAHHLYKVAHQDLNATTLIMVYLTLIAGIVLTTGHKHGPPELIVDQMMVLQDSMQWLCAAHVEVETLQYSRVSSLKVLNSTDRFSLLNTQPLIVRPNTMNGTVQLLNPAGTLRLL